MDIFKIDRHDYDEGLVINGIKSATWIERYNSPGEFTIFVDPTEEFRTIFKIGDLISHTDTKSVMMIEDHEIDESSPDQPVQLKITGRTFDAVMMENRVLHQAFIDWHSINLTSDDVRLIMSATEDAWTQVVYIIGYFLENAFAEDNTKYNLDNFHVSTPITSPPTIGGGAGPRPRDLAKLALLSDVVYQIIQEANLGIRVERPDLSHSDLEFIIHPGVDLSATVIFDWEHGDVDNARYLWSNRIYRNSAFVSTQSAYYTKRMFDVTATGIDFRVMAVNVTDFDPDYGPFPSSGDITTTQDNLGARGTDALSNAKMQSLLDANISKNARFHYGIDYNIGDIVKVHGNYDISALFRVTEYARTMDHDAESGFPTISVI